MTEKEILRGLIAEAGPLYWVAHNDMDGAKAWEKKAEKALADTEDTGGEMCPTCGSSYPAKCICILHARPKKRWAPCENTWHDSAGNLPPKEQDDEAMDLHGEIMNLRIKLGAQVTAVNESTEPPILSLSDIAIMAYKRGHRDARHGAAELACKCMGENQ